MARPQLNANELYVQEMNAAEQAKRTTEAFLVERGVPINPNLPAIDIPKNVASPEEVRRRCVVLHATAAVAYGADREAVCSWIEAQQLLDAMSGSESAFVLHGEGESSRFQTLPEALWQLVWVVELIPKIDQFSVCSDELVQMTPTIGEDISSFVAAGSMKGINEILAEADLVYRLHWAVREAALRGRKLPTGLPEYVSLNRFHAMSWVLDPDSGWDHVDLST